MFQRNLTAIRNRAFRIFIARKQEFHGIFEDRQGNTHVSQETGTLEFWQPNMGCIPARGDLRGHSSRNNPWSNSGLTLVGLKAKEA